MLEEARVHPPRRPSSCDHIPLAAAVDLRGLSHRQNRLWALGSARPFHLGCQAATGRGDWPWLLLFTWPDSRT